MATCALRKFNYLVKYRNNAVFLMHYSSPPPVAVPEAVSVALRPVYPEIKDMSPEGLKKQHRQAWYDKIRALPTPEQKIYEIVRQLRHSAFLLNSGMIQNVPLEFTQFCTRTHVVHHLPDTCASVDVDPVYERLKPHLLEAIKTETEHLNRKHAYTDEIQNANLRDEGIIKQLVSLILRGTSVEHSHLQTAQVSCNSRCDAFWWNCEFHSTQEDEFKDIEHMDLLFQFRDVQSLQIRTEYPLDPVVERDNPLCTDSQIPYYPYYPECHGLEREEFYLTTNPGYWHPDPCDFGFLTFYSRAAHRKAMADNQMMKQIGLKDWSTSMGILGSFASLLAHSTYLGFTPYHDLTYPLVTQTIITDGKTWNFFTYQMNTCCLHSDVDTKTYKNILWAPEEMQLYDTIEDGNFKGLNEDVLRLLVKFILNRPRQDGMELRPFVGTPPLHEELVKIRTEMQKLHTNSEFINNPKYHIPLWEKIYKLHPKAPPSPLLKVQVRKWPDESEAKKNFTSV